MPRAFPASKTHQMPAVPECKAQTLKLCFRSTRSQSRASVDECSGGNLAFRSQSTGAAKSALKDLKRSTVESIDGTKQTCKKKPRTSCVKNLEKSLSKGIGYNSSQDPSIPNSAAAVQNEHHSLNHVMSCFQGDGPGIVVGRAEERAALQTFLESTVGAKKSGGMYICGKPGCGKTALVRDCIAGWRRKAKVIMVNCLAAGGLREVYVQLLHALSPTTAVDKNIVSNLEQLLFDASGDHGRGGMVLLVLDELDSAMGATGSVPEDDLRKLFGWIHRERSRVVLLGIGNMLDLFNRSLAAFASSLEMLSFPPYSAADMLAILNARLAAPLPTLQAPRADADDNGVEGDSGPGPSAPGDALVKFDPAALDLCGRRMSAESGDVRKALQACRLAACAAAATGAAGGGGVGGVCAVGVGVMARKLSELLAGQGAQRFGGVAALPLHQQLLLCTLARHAAAGLPPLAPAALGAAYAQLCRRHGLTPVAAPEVVAVVDGLVDGGLVARGKNGMAALAVPLPHLTAALQAAAPLIASILAAP